MKKYSHVVVLAAALVSPLFAKADSTFMNINFSGDAVGSAPAVSYPNAPSPVSQPYAIGGYGPNTVDPYGDNPLVASDGTATVENVGGMTKAAVLTTSSANNQTGAVWLDTQYLVNANQFGISFDLNVLNSAPDINADPDFRFSLNGTQQQAGVLFSLNQFSSDGAVFTFVASPTSGSQGYFGFRDSTTITSFFQYNVGQTYHVDLVGNFNSQTVDAFIDGNLVASDSPMRGGKTSALLTESFFYMDAQPDYNNSVALDNVRGAVVPLPQSVYGGGVLLAGMAVVASRKRLRRQSV